MKSHIVVTANDESEAKGMALKALGTTEDEITITKLKDSSYYCHKISTHADFSLNISPDGKMAVLAAAYPSFGPGDPLTSKKIIDRLREDKVTTGVMHDLIVQTVEQVNATNLPLFNVCIAKQIDPVAGKSTQLELVVKRNSFVEKGCLLANRHPHTKGEMGYTIFGKEILASNGSKIEFHHDDRVTKDEQGKYISNIPGYFQYNDHKVSIVPLIEVSDDGLTASAFLKRREDTVLVTEAQIGDSLSSLGIKHGVKLKNLTESFGQLCSQEDDSLMAVVAHGTPPVHGKDGRIDFKVNLEKTIGQLLEDGRIDFRERNMPQSISKGGLICTVISPEAGKDGIDVFGNEIEYEKGKASIVSAGQNVVSNDAIQFTSEIDGMVMFKDHVLSVHEGFEHVGDVDFDTGHLNCRGYVTIKGSVKATFNVIAESHITITETAEDCLLTAGGDIDVLRGIFHSQSGGKVIAAGSVRTYIAHQAWVEAHEDIIITGGEAFNSHLKAGCKVICNEKKGTILGGTVRGALGIEAKTVGSESGVKTILKVGYDLLATEEMRKQMNYFRDEIKLINQVIGEDSTLGKIENVGGDKKKKVFTELYLFREESRSLLAELIATRLKLMEEKKELGGVSIKVSNVIYPGVELFIYDATMKTTSIEKRVEFVFDPEKNRIVSRNLK